MFSVFKKLTKSNDDRTMPVPMSSSLQKKFSRGVHYNMKILIKGDRNVGKSCLLQRLQGGPFIEEYLPTEQIQVAPINWTYKNTDHIVKVEVWEIVDKGKAKKKAPLGLKLENQLAPTPESDCEYAVLDATFLDVYKNATGVILMLDITKPWTFDYVMKELQGVPPDLPVVVLGNHCDMQHHRQVHPHHIDQLIQQAKATRTAPLRYAESSMRNGFGLRLLHRFLSVPFLRLQKISLLEQLQRNQKDIENAERELDEYQCSDEANYDVFIDNLNNKRRLSSNAEPKNIERSPSIVLGGGKPIVPPNVNPLSNTSLNPMGIKALNTNPEVESQQSQYVSPELYKPKTVIAKYTPTATVDALQQNRIQPKVNNQPFSKTTGAGGGDLDEFYAGTLDSSFLDDMSPMSPNQDMPNEIDSDDENAANPMVAVYEDLDIELSGIETPKHKLYDSFKDMSVKETPGCHGDEALDVEFPLWLGDSSTRRSPEGNEYPDAAIEATEKPEKKHKKKKSKDREEKSQKKEKKKHRSKGEKRSAQDGLLAPTPNVSMDYFDDYDSI